MPFFKSLIDRTADRAKALEKQAELARRMTARPIVAEVTKPVAIREASSAIPTMSVVKAATLERPWASVRAGSANLTLWSRVANQQVFAQPWTKDLVDIVLESAQSGGIQLCLVWPTKLDSLPVLHAMANMERVFESDVRGLRTLMFPGSHSTRAGLQAALVNREQLTNRYRSFWTTKENGETSISTCTSSPSYVAALGALNDVRIRHEEVPNPSFAELVPAFVFGDPKKGWTSTVHSPLDRTLSKVERLANRRELRDKVNTEWSDAAKAPCALMVVHHSTKKEAWKQALNSRILKGDGRPEVLLLDATTAASRTNYNAVKRIPDFLRCAREQGLNAVGTVVVTDDPKTFFILRAQLNEQKLSFNTRVWAAEAEHPLLSPSPCTADWKPAQRSNSNFSVGIVDRDASQVALAFQKLALAAGGEESPQHRALMEACLYVLRLSNMPAGYSDLTAQTSHDGGLSFASQRDAWTTVSVALAAQLEGGVLNSQRSQVDAAIRKAERLIDDWNDATPMAARLLAEIRRHAASGKHGVAVVLPNSKYIHLAHRFLERKLGAQWTELEPRLEWHTLSSVGRTLSPDVKGKHFVFVGVNPDVLRILVTHPYVPHGTVVLAAYKQAESTLITLLGMRDLEAFKPYRGRIGLLAQELDRRLKEVPNPLVISKLGDMSMTFRLDDNGRPGSGGEQNYYKFELEGGGRAYASGWVYRYEPDEDPFFRRAGASTIRPGDFIFDMSDELRAKVEDALRVDGDRSGAGSVVDPLRMLMRLYHANIQTRCQLLFKATKRSVLAREIRAKMMALNPRAKECKPSRVYYWLELPAEGDTRPHASKDESFFRLFCKALDLGEEDGVQYWNLIRKTRRFNQYLGRELVARYAEILFQPESANTYRKVPEEVIKQLQQEALRCVYRVERVIPPGERPVI